MKKLIKFISVEEFDKLLKAEKVKEYKLAMKLMFGSGLRLSEVLGSIDGKIKPLKKDMINFSAHQVRIFGKGSKERVTVLPPYIKENELNLLPLDINRRTFQYRLGWLGERILKKKVNPHQLRHGFANYMANERGMPLPYVQAMLGHSRLDTTGIYTRANPIQAITKAWESY